MGLFAFSLKGSARLLLVVDSNLHSTPLHPGLVVWSSLSLPGLLFRARSCRGDRSICSRFVFLVSCGHGWKAASFLCKPCLPKCHSTLARPPQGPLASSLSLRHDTTTRPVADCSVTCAVVQPGSNQSMKSTGKKPQAKCDAMQELDGSAAGLSCSCIASAGS